MSHFWRAKDSSALLNAGLDLLDILPLIELSMSVRGGCFAAGTLLRTPQGGKPIETFKVGDEILSRNESSPDAPIETKRVEAIFVREAPLMRLTISGRTIATTAEHPFWVHGKGWTPAKELKPGDQLASDNGQWLAVEEIADRGEMTIVYNMRVADFHTYFVGGDNWGWAVWAHNAYLNPEDIPALAAQYRDLRNSGVRGRIRVGHPDTGAPLSDWQMRQVKKYANTNFADMDRSGIPGPRTQHDESGHNQLVAYLSANLPEGHLVVAGGRNADMTPMRRERRISTEGGYLDSRRPDLLIRRPDGSHYGINVGKTEISGRPVLREREALHDLTVHGRLEMLFFSYGVQR